MAVACRRPNAQAADLQVLGSARRGRSHRSRARCRLTAAWPGHVLILMFGVVGHRPGASRSRGDVVWRVVEDLQSSYAQFPIHFDTEVTSMAAPTQPMPSSAEARPTSTQASVAPSKVAPTAPATVTAAPLPVSPASAAATVSAVAQASTPPVQPPAACDTPDATVIDPQNAAFKAVQAQIDAAVASAAAAVQAAMADTASAANPRAAADASVLAELAMQSNLSAAQQAMHQAMHAQAVMLAAAQAQVQVAMAADSASLASSVPTPPAAGS